MQNDPHSDHAGSDKGGTAGEGVQDRTGRVAREPIFNRMPGGVVVVAALMLGVYLALQFVNPDTLAAIRYDYGVVPVRDWPGLASDARLASFTALLTSQFLHSGTLHLVMNLAMLLQAGPICEAGFGRDRTASFRFVGFFLVCGILGGLMYCIINPQAQAPTIGASGAISGVFGGFLWAAIGLARPGESMLRPVISSAAVFLLINVGLAWIGRVTGFVPIAWEAHLGGFLAGVLLYPVFARLGR